VQNECLASIAGVCVEKSINLADLLMIFISLAGLAGIIIAFWQLRIGQRAQRAQSAFEIFRELFSDPKQIEFFYRLDYTNHPEAWIFDSSSFPQSEEEQHLDRILYFFSFVGYLLRAKQIGKKDLGWLTSRLSRVMSNLHVAAYLEWLKQEMPNHTAFRDCIYLYGEMLGREGQTYDRLKRYMITRNQ
jgi:hypothetical protein